MARCEGCGAQLPGAAPGSPVTCAYCGAAASVPPPREELVRGGGDHATPSQSPARPYVADPRHAHSGLRWLIGISIFVLVALGLGLAAALAAWSALEAYTPVRDVVPGIGGRTLDPAGLPTPFEALDPVAVYPWALARAREWAPDATLTSSTSQGVALDGRANAVASPSGADDPNAPGADFVFVSPARMQAARSMRQVSSQPVMTGIRIEVSDGRVEAVANTHVDDDGEMPPAFPQPACGLDRVLAAMRARGLELPPAYVLVAEHRAGRWSWRVHMTDLRDGPSVYADDCSPR